MAFGGGLARTRPWLAPDKGQYGARDVFELLLASSLVGCSICSLSIHGLSSVRILSVRCGVAKYTECLMDWTEVLPAWGRVSTGCRETLLNV